MCGVREYVFRDNPVKSLLDLYVREKTAFEQIILLAHNSSGFDSQLILNYLLSTHKNIEPEIVLNGKNIILLQFGRAKFIDSLNYFHMKLSNLPKTFDLPGDLSKGWFPHLFSTLENSGYTGPIPDASYYSPDTMGSKERESFLKWYSEIPDDYIFDFQAEIVRYCRADVDILRQACVKFRKIFLTVGKICPFRSATTRASACSMVYRKNFLKENTIGIIPPLGYRRVDKHS